MGADKQDEFVFCQFIVTETKGSVPTKEPLKIIVPAPTF